MSEDEFPEAPLETNFDYFDAGMDMNALEDLDVEGRATVLDRLGPAHFRSKGFSFMGFLQTVYDHIAEHTGTAQPQAADEPVPSLGTDASEAMNAEEIVPAPASPPAYMIPVEDDMTEEESRYLDESMPKNERRM